LAERFAMIEEKLVDEFRTTFIDDATITVSSLASVISKITLEREGRVEL
jgi:hypothetical protein